MKWMLIVTVLAGMGAAPEIDRRIRVDYDQVKDVTTYSVEPILLKTTAAPPSQKQFFFSIYEEKNGKLQRKPSTSAMLMFAAHGSRIAYDDVQDHYLHILADGKRNGIAFSGYETRSETDNWVEVLHVRLLMPQLTQIANSKKVSGEVGQTRFDFAPDELELLRDFIRTIKRPAPVHAKAR